MVVYLDLTPPYQQPRIRNTKSIITQVFKCGGIMKYNSSYFCSLYPQIFNNLVLVMSCNLNFFTLCLLDVCNLFSFILLFSFSLAFHLHHFSFTSPFSHTNSLSHIFPGPVPSFTAVFRPLLSRSPPPSFSLF